MNKKKKLILSMFVIICLTLVINLGIQYFFLREETSSKTMTQERIELPETRSDETELGKLIYQRRSVRSFDEQKIPLDKISDILWSTVGITVDAVSGPTRAAPSAGATDPLYIFFSAHRVEGLDEGVYLYHPENHEISLVVSEDRSAELTSAGLNQSAIKDAPFTIIITANYQHTTSRYGERGNQYVHIEAGHAAQNANLMAENLGLKGVIIGAFHDEQLQEALGGTDKDPLIILPLGREN